MSPTVPSTSSPRWCRLRDREVRGVPDLRQSHEGVGAFRTRRLSGVCAPSSRDQIEPSNSPPARNVRDPAPGGDARRSAPGRRVISDLTEGGVTRSLCCGGHTLRVREPAVSGSWIPDDEPIEIGTTDHHRKEHTMSTTTTTTSPASTYRSEKKRFVRRAAAMLLAVGIVAGVATAVGPGSTRTAFADESQDETLSPTSLDRAGTICYGTGGKRSATKNALGQVVHGVIGEVTFCVNSKTGKISSVTTRKEHVEDYLWNWNGWNGNVNTGGVGSTSFSFYIKGTFKECAAYCFHSASNWLKITVRANGSATYAWG